MNSDRKSIHSIVSALREGQSGLRDEQICRKYGIRKELLERWRKSFSNLLDMDDRQLAEFQKQFELLKTAGNIDGTEEEQKLNYRIALKWSHNTLGYIQSTGQAPNYINPQLWTEKMQWRKLFDRNPLFAICCNKLSAREYVQEKCPDLYLPEIISVFDNANDILAGNLPVPCVIKTTNGSGDVVVVKESNQLQQDKLMQTLQSWQSRQHHGASLGEWGYTRSRRQLFVEGFIGHKDEDCPVANIKFFVFSGRVRFVQVESWSRQGYHLTFFDDKGNRLPWRKWIGHMPAEKMPGPDPGFSLPANFEKMREMAEALAGNMDHLRVDLYSFEGQIIFSELSPYDGSGFSWLYDEADRFDVRPSAQLNAEVGSYWLLPANGEQ